KSGCGSRENCTTWSRTPCPPSMSRPAPQLWCCAIARMRPPSRLQAIRTASKNGLRELRAILNVLRQADDAEPTAPAPGLAELDALVAGADQAGLPTTLTITGERAPLPAGVDLAAYRIIQESLTNAIRHAGPATATVSLAYRGGRLLIEVVDTGRG